MFVYIYFICKVSRYECISDYRVVIIMVILLHLKQTVAYDKQFKKNSISFAGLLADEQWNYYGSKVPSAFIKTLCWQMFGWVRYYKNAKGKC